MFEEELVKNEKSEVSKISYDIVADPDCLLCVADMENFVKVLGGSLATILSRGKILESINKVPIFQQLPQTKKNLLIQTLKKQKIENGKAIINQDVES